MQSHAYWLLIRIMNATIVTVVLLLGAVGLSGCASRDQLLAPSSPTAWEAEDFTVRFVAGQRTFGTGYPPSRYEVTPSRLGKSGQLTIGSQHSTGGFGAVVNPAPANYIRILQDPHAESLLIQETIPNDCGPCSNYIWIRPAGSDAFTFTYLQLPERSSGTGNGIDSEFPDVVSLRGGTLTYQYPTGSPVRSKIERIPTLKGPTPPG